MKFSEIKSDARESLKGNWGKGVAFVAANILIIFAFTFLTSFILGMFLSEEMADFVIEIISLIFSIPIGYGIIAQFIKLRRGKDVHAFDFLSIGLSNFKKSWAVAWAVTEKFALLIILLVLYIVGIPALALTAQSNAIVGIIVLIIFVAFLVTLILSVPKCYSYALVWFVAYDNPDMKAKEIVEKSKEIIYGNRMNYFLFGLSFIGWALLNVLTLGIGSLWLVPYMNVGITCFYERLAGIPTQHIEENKDNEPHEESNNPIA